MRFHTSCSLPKVVRANDAPSSHLGMKHAEAGAVAGAMLDGRGLRCCRHSPAASAAARSGTGSGSTERGRVPRRLAEKRQKNWR